MHISEVFHNDRSRFHDLFLSSQCHKSIFIYHVISSKIFASILHSLVHYDLRLAYKLSSFVFLHISQVNTKFPQWRSKMLGFWLYFCIHLKCRCIIWRCLLNESYLYTYTTFSSNRSMTSLLHIFILFIVCDA